MKIKIPKGKTYILPVSKIILICFFCMLLIAVFFYTLKSHSFSENVKPLSQPEQTLTTQNAIIKTYTSRNQTKSLASTPTSYYARVNNGNVYIFSEPVDNSSYHLFIIPETYFIKLTANANDPDNKFYVAEYLDVNGYIKKSDVTAVSGKPAKPYASQVSFRVFCPSGLELRRTPNSETPFNYITTISYLETNLIFYGICEGNAMIPQKNKIWYYCKYLGGNNDTFGYLYSELCDLLPGISLNTEVLELIEGELFSDGAIPVQNPEDNLFSLSTELKTIIIICASLPCLFIIYLLFKPTKLMTDNGGKRKKKFNRLKKSEYYEYED